MAEQSADEFRICDSVYRGSHVTFVHGGENEFEIASDCSDGMKDVWLEVD